MALLFCKVVWWSETASYNLRLTLWISSLHIRKGFPQFPYHSITITLAGVPMLSLNLSGGLHTHPMALRLFLYCLLAFATNSG